MGVTIHFEGSIAKAEGWSSEIAAKVATLTRVRDEQDWDYVGPVKGVVISTDEDCDHVRLEFDSDLYAQEFN